MKSHSKDSPADTMTIHSPEITVATRFNNVTAASSVCPRRRRLGDDPVFMDVETSSFEDDDQSTVFLDQSVVKEGGSWHDQRLAVLKSPPSRNTGIRPKNNVSFHGEVLVVKFDRVTERDSHEVWWTFEEMDGFRSHASTTKCKYRRFGARRGSRCRNHIRRILVQQGASHDMDGTVDPRALAITSLASSKRSKEVAVRSALKMERDVEDDLFFRSKISKSMCLGSNRWVVDYYMGPVIDTLTTTVYCGILPM